MNKNVSEQYVTVRLPIVNYVPLLFSPELGRSWTTWGDRRDWRSSITIPRACAGCTSLGPGILLGRRCRHHLQRFLGRAGRRGLWGGPRGGGVTFSPTENLVLPRALTISTPGTYRLRTAHCYGFMSLWIHFHWNKKTFYIIQQSACLQYLYIYGIINWMSSGEIHAASSYCYCKANIFYCCSVTLKLLNWWNTSLLV